MDRSKLEIEREIVKKIIHEVHDQTTRISDSCQREIILLVRARIPRGKTWEELDHNEIKFLINEFSKTLHKEVPKSKGHNKRAVVRNSILDKIKRLLSDIWPFGE